MELCLRFLRENPNKLCFTELSQKFCDTLPEPQKMYSKGKLEALSYLPKIIACFWFYQHKHETLAFQPNQTNQN